MEKIGENWGKVEKSGENLGNELENFSKISPADYLLVRLQLENNFPVFANICQDSPEIFQIRNAVI
ncbi:MAG: hypothetical protein ACI3ZY_10045 [Parabacteroides sp.]